MSLLKLLYFLFFRWKCDTDLENSFLKFYVCFNIEKKTIPVYITSRYDFT